jgi:uridine phosphorylase
VADADLVCALRERARATALDVHTGVVLTSDLFYPHPVLGPDLPLWQRAGCIAVEMELATLLVIAALHGARAGGILAVDGNPIAAADTDMSGYQPFREVVATAVEATLAVALDVLAGAAINE